MSLVQLAEKDHLKLLISQNTDGMHRKSGIPPERMAELHGNANLDHCENCEREHMRDFYTRTSKKCDTPGCGGVLRDTIINFGENLNDGILDKAFDNCKQADLFVVIGSSLRVTPAADMPLKVVKNKIKGKLVIINLQKTPYDADASLCIHGKCDDVIELLMKKLGYAIPTWKMERRLQLSLVKEGKQIEVMGVDSNGAAF